MAEDVMNYMNNIKEGAISDDDLDQVAGGACTSGGCNSCTMGGNIC